MHRSTRSTGQRAVLGHTIATLLDCGAPEKEQGLTNRGVRATALATLSTLLGCLPDAGALAAFLPGVSSAAARIMLGDYKQGQAIFVLAIKLWTTVVARVLDDRRLAIAAGSDSQADAGAGTGADGGGDDGRSLSVAQNAEWKTTTAENLKAHLDKLTGAINHSSWKVLCGVALVLDGFPRIFRSHARTQPTPCVPCACRASVHVSGMLIWGCAIRWLCLVFMTSGQA